MRTCRHCGEEIEYGRYKFHDCCEKCAEERRNDYPSEGDECGICGGEIVYLYTKSWCSHYECTTCGSRWAYD